MSLLRALTCISLAAFAAVNEAKKISVNEAQTPQDPIIGNWSNLTAKDNFTASVTFGNGAFGGSWLAPSPRSLSTFACSPYTPGPSAYSCYFFDLGVMLANLSSSSNGWQLTWSDSSVWTVKALSADVTQVQANMTLTGVSLASLSPAQQTGLRNAVGAAIASEAGVPTNAVVVTLIQVSFLLLSQSSSSQTGSILVSATITAPTSSATSLTRSLSSSSTLPSTVSSSVRSNTGVTVTASTATASVVTTTTTTTTASVCNIVAAYNDDGTQNTVVANGIFNTNTNVNYNRVNLVVGQSLRFDCGSVSRIGSVRIANGNANWGGTESSKTWTIYTASSMSGPWTSVGTVGQFTATPAAQELTAPAGIVSRYIKMSCASNWLNGNQCVLRQVKFGAR